jgi:conjugal transfer pilus assembly protein TrbC
MRAAIITLIAVVGCATMSWGQPPQYPSDEQIRNAQRITQDILNREDIRNPATGSTGRPMPELNMKDVKVSPTPNIPIPDEQQLNNNNLMDIVEKGQQQPAKLPQPARLYAMVSLSIPKASLQRLQRELEQVDGVMVFRGVPDGWSLDQFSNNLQKVLGDKTSAMIHPILFERYHITMVPAYVLTTDDAKSDCEATADEYISVSGDVGLDYSMSYMEHNAPAMWLNTIRSMKEKLAKKP